MKIIDKKTFEENFKASLIKANYTLREDIKDFFNNLYSNTINEKDKFILNCYIKNYKIAETERRPLCQDTGYIECFITIGRDVIIDFDLNETLNKIAKQVYNENYFRNSMTDPISRKPLDGNYPVFTNIELSSIKEFFKVEILIKGGGSENVTKTGLLSPTITLDDISKFIIDHLNSIKDNACPPYILGVCIGGNLEKALYYSKYLLLKDNTCMNEEEKRISKYIFKEIESKFKDQGNILLRVIALNVKILPCHIATMPVAISVGCNSVRQSEFAI